MSARFDESSLARRKRLDDVLLMVNNELDIDPRVRLAQCLR
jgi:hypothetical protein